MKNVLVLVHDDEGQESRLQAALDLTRALGGHMTCLDVVSPPLVMTDPYAGTGLDLAIDCAREIEMDNRAAVEQRLAKEDVAWTMREAFGEPAYEIEEASGLADLIVVSSRPAGRHDLADIRRIVAKVAMNAGRPVVAVPPERRGIDVAGDALVAWDGSDAAAEVLHQALPLLQLANSVELLLVNLPGRAGQAEEAAAYLSRHGIAAKIGQRMTKGPVSDVLLGRACEIGAGYIVLGAFGHGHAIEAVFGGVTLGMLLKSEVPLVLAH